MSMLNIKNLSIKYNKGDDAIYAVNNVSFDIKRGEIYGLVGESGSGKSTIADAILGLLPPNAESSSEALDFKDQNLNEASEETLQDLRWEDIAYIPQSAMDALDPMMTTGDQTIQAIRKHRDLSREAASNRAEEVFETVGIDSNRLDDYPHEFSGGMRQRVTIAMAMALNPDLIIADEPTTGLDVIIQNKIISKIMEVQEEIDSSLLMITHDMGVVAETCDRMSVLYGGAVMEAGATSDVLGNPSNPYTMGLKNSFPDFEGSESVSIPGSPPIQNQEPNQCVFVDRCPFAGEACTNSHPNLREVEDDHVSACHYTDKRDEMRSEARDIETWGITEAESEGKRESESKTVLQTSNLKKYFSKSQSLMEKLSGKEPEWIKAVDDISLSIEKSEVLGLAGESGCGKSTLGETVLQLEEPTGGTVRFNGNDITEENFNTKQFREDAQIVFQDPYESLNPRQRVLNIIKEPLDIHNKLNSKEERREKVVSTLEKVGLDPAERYLDSNPHELSGGEKQRVAVARALVVDPDFLVCDEPASMLDISLKVGLLNLLRNIASEEGIGILYISHDIASLAQVSDRIAIMYLGEIVELGNTTNVFADPQHPYTAALVSANPSVDPNVDYQEVQLPGEPPDPSNLPSGCNFAPRCPKKKATCTKESPDLSERGSGQRVACHYPMEENEKITDLLANLNSR